MNEEEPKKEKASSRGVSNKKDGKLSTGEMLFLTAIVCIFAICVIMGLSSFHLSTDSPQSPEQPQYPQNNEPEYQPPIKNVKVIIYNEDSYRGLAVDVWISEGDRLPSYHKRFDEDDERYVGSIQTDIPEGTIIKIKVVSTMSTGRILIHDYTTPKFKSTSTPVIYLHHDGIHIGEGVYVTYTP